MKAAEIRQLTDAEISNLIVEEKKTLHKMKFGHAISPIENPMKIRDLKKTIARLMTELSTRTLMAS